MVNHEGRISHAPAPEKIVTVLAISDSAEDHNWLNEVFRHSNWKIMTARSCREAFEVLQSSRVPVVLCDCTLPDGGWKSLLNRFSQWPEEPLLVVMSRQADDRLWAEVLNLGGYDVLSKPFDRSEVIRVISAAWLQWRQRGKALAPQREVQVLAQSAIAS
jgi:DNA-binding NtrC family response regulator